MNSYAVCSQCAPGVAYGDWSHLDYNGVSDEYRGLIYSAVESMGFVSLTGPVEHLDYFRCYVCGMDAIGGTTFDRVG